MLSVDKEEGREIFIKPPLSEKEKYMNKSETKDTMMIESDSRRGEFYTVNIKSLACSCPHFHKKLSGLPLEDPHRLCKHLIKALTINGIPDHLKEYKEDIVWFADHNSAFTSMEKALKNKRWDKRFPLPNGSITTVTSSKKKKYCYVEGMGDEKKILATIPLIGGVVSYTISNFYGSYDLNTQASRIPWNYRYVEQAVINWIVDEYNQVKNPGAPIATKKMIEYKLNPDPIPEGNIKTISIEKHDKSSGILELPNGTIHIPKDGEEYYHVIGEANNNQIEAFISSQNTSIFYSINGSRIYIFDVSPLSSETEVKLPGMETNSPMKLVITFDSSDKFPKQYDFMKRAMIKWLTDEYCKIAKRG